MIPKRAKTIHTVYGIHVLTHIEVISPYLNGSVSLKPVCIMS